MLRPRLQRFHRLDFLLLVSFCFCLSSCSSLITSAMRPAVGNIQQQTNINLVCEGTPAYLLMIDSMLVSSPNNKSLLLTASQSYSAYAAALEECGGANDTRIPPIAEKAKFYGIRLLNHYLPLNNGQDYEELENELADLNRCDLPNVFWGTFGWLTWVKNQKGSPEAIADLVIIEKIMERLLAIDESYQGGSIHLFFGSYYAAKPAMFGGKPDLSRYHFEKALDVSEREFLMVHVNYAETLARATLDQELHDKLLNEVLEFPLDSAPEFRLSNEIAVSKAKQLLNDDYFGE